MWSLNVGVSDFHGLDGLHLSSKYDLNVEIDFVLQEIKILDLQRDVLESFSRGRLC
jgi:hypothetical protein